MLTELGLIELDLDGTGLPVIDGIRSDLELSPAYRAARESSRHGARARRRSSPVRYAAAATG